MKLRTLRCITLFAICAITPLLNSCLLEDIGGTASKTSAGLPAHLNNVQQIINTGNSRGYITTSEAQSFLTSLQYCAEEADTLIENAGVAGNNSSVYRSLPTMNGTQGAVNGLFSLILGQQQRGANEKAEQLKQTVLSAVSWFEAMRSAGRIR